MSDMRVLRSTVARRLTVVFAAIAIAGAPATEPAAAQHAAAQQAAREIAGRWAGELEVQGVRLPLVFHIGADAGVLTATMDSPMQGVHGIPVDSVRLAGDRLVLAVPALNGVYSGRLVEPNTLEGEWRQGPMSLPLELRRGDDVAGGGGGP
jgi:hypothetical protein